MVLGIPHPDTSRPATVQVNDRVAVRGFVHPATGVANYLGLPFATVPARFREAQLRPLDSFEGDIDTRHYGPRCPQPEDGSKEPRKHMFALNVDSDALPSDELACLVANVYVPETSGSKKLPVFVWIHGGGWVLGDGGPDYDGNWQTAYALAHGRPFVFVALNYRLGYHGFLASRELRADAAAHGEPWHANQGLHDQHVGLQWVQRHIHLFGGDPAQVTIAGESAGGWSVLAHLLRDGPAHEPVCRRGQVMSSPLLPFPSEAESQAIFDGLVAMAGTPDSASAAEKVAAVRGLTSAQLTEALGGSFVRPNWDPTLWPGLAPYAPFDTATKLPDWVDGVVAGATRHEGYFFGLPFKQWSVPDLLAMLHTAIPDDEARNAVFAAYGIDADAKDLADRVIRITTDSMFAPTPHLLAALSSDAQPVHVYRFDQVDAYPDQPFHGVAHHALDNAFVCRLPTVAEAGVAPDDMVATSDRLSEVIAAFVYGDRPWGAYHDGKPVYVFDGPRSGVHTEPPYGETPAWRAFWGTEHWDMFRTLGMTLLRARRPA